MPRIRLIPIDEALRRSFDESTVAFQAFCGASLGGNAALVRQVVTQTLDLHRRVPRGPEWGGFVAADADRALVVGTCGYACGPEANGAVEIAYFTFPEFAGRGYATAMAAELRDRALRSTAVREVIAHTLPEPGASTRVLEKVGLRRDGEARDPDAGAVWRWAMPRGGVVLRPVEESDLPTFFEHQLDPDATRMADFPSRDREAFMAHWTKILADDAVVVRTILLDGQVAGNIVYFEQSGEPLVGYWIGRAFWGKGVASLALSEFLRIVPARPLYARVAKHNAASIRVLEKRGFEASGEDIEEFIMALRANSGAHRRNQGGKS